MSVFDFTNYQAFLADFIATLPKKGWGFPQRLSEHLGIHPSHTSQVLTGQRDFSLEQGVATAEFIGLGPSETDYFIGLLHLSRAGTPQAKKYYQRKLLELKRASLSLSNRVNQDKILSEEEKSVFYSSYMYSAVRLFCTINEGVTLEEIRARFELSLERTNEILEFLIRTRLIFENAGKFSMGTQHTHVEKSSPHLSRHHLNWRVQSLKRTESLSEEELQFTGPISLSRNDFDKVREIMVKGINETLKVVKKSPAEDIACLCIDLFWIQK
jgi:uncharacterized protein (TIGR02147 family)